MPDRSTDLERIVSIFDLDAGEIAAFGMRMNAGWPFQSFIETTGYDLRQEWSAEIDQLLDCGWASVDPYRFRLTPIGLRFSDAAAELFLK